MSFSSPYTCPFLYTIGSSSSNTYNQTYDITCYGSGLLDAGPVEYYYPICLPDCNWDLLNCSGWTDCTGVTSGQLWPSINFTVSFEGKMRVAVSQDTLLTTTPPTSQTLCYNNYGITVDGTITIVHDITDNGSGTTTADVSLLFQIDPTTGNYYTQLNGGTSSKNLGYDSETGYNNRFDSTPMFILNLNPSTGQTWFTISMTFQMAAEAYNNSLYYTRSVIIYSTLTSVLISSSVPSISTLYYEDITVSSFPNAYSSSSTFSILICGAGGSAQTTSTSCYGGAGAGGMIVASKIPYYLGGAGYLESIEITFGVPTDPQIGGNYAAGTTTINFIYPSHNELSMYIYGAFNVGSTDGTAGSEGGTCNVTDCEYYPTNLSYSKINGSWGGSNNTNAGNSYSGTSNGYTCSGSAANNTSNASSSVYAAGDTVFFGFDFLVSSQGAGGPTAVSNGSPVKVLGFGGGGCSTPSNYNGENNDNSYRIGKAGCVILQIVN